jgi:hypothetical protein
MSTLLYPNTELVACAWVGSLPGLTSDMVATQLPDDNSAWAASGFVTLQIVGGSPNLDVPMRSPVLEISAWATRPGSNKPPWGRANNLIEAVLAGTYAQDQNRPTVLPGLFPRASVRAAQAVTEPRRVYADPADYARYAMNVQLWWTALEVA